MVQKNSLNKPKIIAIIGPTASGKTSLAVRLAKKFNGEVVSADSMQIYKGLDVGTAKVTTEEMQGVKHHLIDIVLPHERYTAAQWNEDAKRVIQEIISRGKLPIIAGGTGLYISSLLYGYNFYNAQEDIKAREKYYNLIEEKGADYVYDYILNKAPHLASQIDKNKHRQLARYLEIIEDGDVKSLEKGKEKSEYDYLLFGLDVPRETLYENINKRVDIMVNSGLKDEVQELMKDNKFIGSQASLAIGYKEVIDYFNGITDFNSSIELVKQHSRNYAKRQLTWMRKMENLVWVHPTDKNIENMVQEFLKGENHA